MNINKKKRWTEMVIRRRMKIRKKYKEKWELKMKRIDNENKR